MVHVLLGIAALVFALATALYTRRLLRYEVERSVVGEGAMVVATALLFAGALAGFDPAQKASGTAVLFIVVAASVIALIVQRWGPPGRFPLLGPVTSALVGVVALALAIHAALPERAPSGPVAAVTILHIAATLVGYLLFMPAFVLGNLFVAQTWRLKTKQPSATRLPPLGTLERGAWRLLTLGFVLYTLGIVGGWLSSESARGAIRPQHVVAASSWLVYAIALVRRYVSGWSGVRAAIALMGGFVLTSGAVLLYILR